MTLIQFQYLWRRAKAVVRRTIELNTRLLCLTCAFAFLASYGCSSAPSRQAEAEDPARAAQIREQQARTTERFAAFIEGVKRTVLLVDATAAFYMTHARVPHDHEELEAFTASHGTTLDLTHFGNLSFAQSLEGDLVIHIDVSQFVGNINDRPTTIPPITLSVEREDLYALNERLTIKIDVELPDAPERSRFVEDLEALPFALVFGGLLSLLGGDTSTLSFGGQSFQRHHGAKFDPPPITLEVTSETVRPLSSTIDGQIPDVEEQPPANGLLPEPQSG